jgi:alkyldihydroxyacetonephosphate synthase
VLARAQARFGTALRESASAPRLEDITLAAPRVTRPPRSRSAPATTTTAPRTRSAKSYPDLARGLARDYASAPDVVAYPRDEAEVAAVLDLGRRRRRDGDAVRRRLERVRRVEPKRNGHKGAVTVDLREMGKVSEVDKTSRAALIEGGTYGPALEAQLKPHGSRCAIFPRASNIPRSAAGSRRAAAGTLRRSTRTSTISSNRCAS